MSEEFNLKLPKRYERLQAIASQKTVDLTKIVKKIPDATLRIEALLKGVRDGGLGRFEFFLGESGSGKTTFLNTLDKFYQPSKVTQVPDSLGLKDIAEFIRNNYLENVHNHIFVMVERDNPNDSDEDARAFFENLRRLFRENSGQVLVVWPITDDSYALRFAKIAWQVGKDSVIDNHTRGIFIFKGLPKDEYREVADITARSLNDGRSLETFGLTETITNNLQSVSATISEFYSNLETESQKINEKFDEVIKEKIIPSVWILLLGDDVNEISLTVATLTKGNRKQVDIDRFIDLLDSPENDAAYLKDWRERRESMPYLFQRLDVRLFEVSPSLAVAVQRVFGDSIVKTKLDKTAYPKSNALDQMRSSKFYQALTGTQLSNKSKLNKPSEKIPQEYRRLQSLASKSDKLLNKGLAEAIRATLSEDGVLGEVYAEKRSIQHGSNLQPDIHIILNDSRIVCLEPTWRTTGQETEEKNKSQNTSTVGHIQQYLLSKILEYVKDLDL